MQQLRILGWALVTVLLSATAAEAASREVRYGPRPTWLSPPPLASTLASPDGAAMRILYYDWQVRLGHSGEETYTAYRVKVLTPDGLSVGNLTGSWNPSTDEITVHTLKIIRGDRTIDVLTSTKFSVIQREDGLESTALDGALTATLQAPGLQVGDELEFAVSIRSADPIFAGKSSGAIQLPLAGGPGTYRARVLWPNNASVRWRASPDLANAMAKPVGDDKVLVEELRDPISAMPTEGAPQRFNVRRLIEFSEFAEWQEVSRGLQPAFERATALAPTSPIRAEAAKIAASTSDPVRRAEAALRLVQDRIRYVYIGLNGANYRPALADETWQRRYGDCKAKTVLLIALLRELGVEAEPVMVNSTGGDGIDQRLPTPDVFDHVLVRARINGDAYWLDGTRAGDRRLATLPPPISQWGLALRPGPVELEAIARTTPILPQQSTVLEIDATGGFETPAKVREELALRGDGTLQTRATLAGLSAGDAERAVKAFFREREPWLKLEAAAWRFDEPSATLILTLSGTGKLEWEGDDEGGHNLAIPGAGFTPPDELARPKEQDATAPWLTDFPTYKRWTTVIRLPPATAKWRWSYSAAPVDLKLGGGILLARRGAPRRGRPHDDEPPDIYPGDLRRTGPANQRWARDIR